MSTSYPNYDSDLGLTQDEFDLLIQYGEWFRELEQQFSGVKSLNADGLRRAQLAMSLAKNVAGFYGGEARLRMNYTTFDTSAHIILRVPQLVLGFPKDFLALMSYISAMGVDVADDPRFLQFEFSVPGLFEIVAHESSLLPSDSQSEFIDEPDSWDTADYACVYEEFMRELPESTADVGVDAQKRLVCVARVLCHIACADRFDWPHAFLIGDDGPYVSFALYANDLQFDTSALSSLAQLLEHLSSISFTLCPDPSDPDEQTIAVVCTIQNPDAFDSEAAEFELSATL